jgi:hypothetical protein
LSTERNCRASRHTREHLPNTALPVIRLGGLDAKKRAADKVDGKELTVSILPK